MIRKVSFLIALVLLTGLSSFAQETAPSTMKFDILSHDFGVVVEGDEAAYDFEFTNISKDTIRLKPEDIRPGCGCTSKDYTKDPIAPGGRGKVTALYGTTGRVGMFNKSITIFQNGNVVSVLYIRGVVIKKEEPVTYTEKELKASSKISLDKTSYNFGKVERGQKVITSVVLKNIGKDTLKFNSTQAACSCINYRLLKEKSATETIEYLLPKESATLELTYFPSGTGKTTDIITLFTNDKTTPRTSISLEADVVESLQQKSVIMEGGESSPFGK